MKKALLVTLTLICSVAYCTLIWCSENPLEKANIIRISCQPNTGGNRDITSGLLFDGNPNTGYSWIFYPPCILLIDLGEEKTFSEVSVHAVGGAVPHR